MDFPFLVISMQEFYLSCYLLGYLQGAEKLTFRPITSSQWAGSAGSDCWLPQTSLPLQDLQPMLVPWPRGEFLGQVAGQIPTRIEGGDLILALRASRLGFRILNSRQNLPSGIGLLNTTVECPQQPCRVRGSSRCKMEILLIILLRGRVDSSVYRVESLASSGSGASGLCSYQLASECRLATVVLSSVLAVVPALFFFLVSRRSFLARGSCSLFFQQIFSISPSSPASLQKLSMYFIYFLVRESIISCYSIQYYSLPILKSQHKPQPPSFEFDSSPLRPRCVYFCIH